MYGGARFACHDPDNAGIRRKRQLVRRVEQALRRQPGLHLLKGSIQISYTVHRHRRAIELVHTVSRIDADAPDGNHLYPVCGAKAQTKRVSPEHNAAHRGVFILQRKVMVS